MRRNIELDDGWYKDSYGPVMAYLKEDGTALLPKNLSGYYYTDRKTGKKNYCKQKNAQLFKREAYCFYNPLPQKKLGIGDLIIYIWKMIY